MKLFFIITFSNRSCYKVYEFYLSETTMKEITRNSLTTQFLSNQLKTYQQILSSLWIEKIQFDQKQIESSPPSLQELEVIIAKTPKGIPEESCKQIMTIRNKSGGCYCNTYY